MNNVPALVIGSDCITGLQTSRILSARGIPVIGIAEDKRHPAIYTRAKQRLIIAPTQGEELVESLLRIAKQLPSRPVLFPCTDMAVLTLSRHRDRLSQDFRFRLPEEEVVKTLIEKSTFHRFAMTEGIPVPKGLIVKDQHDILQARETLRFPCYLKPTVKTPLWEAHIQDKVFRIEESGKLETIWQEVNRWTGDMLVTESIEGGDTNHYTCNCYFSERGEPLVSFVSRKLRQWPPKTGTASLSVAEDNDEVRELTLSLFGKIGFKGLGYIEAKYDDRDGKLYVIEPNIGRPTGRSAMAEASGVELLKTMYCEILGLPLPASNLTSGEPVKWMFLRQDARASYSSWASGKLPLSQWWESVKGRKIFPLFSLSDPLPLLFDIKKNIGKLLARRSQH